MRRHLVSKVLGQLSAATSSAAPSLGFVSAAGQGASAAQPAFHRSLAAVSAAREAYTWGPSGGLVLPGGQSGLALPSVASPRSLSPLAHRGQADVQLRALQTSARASFPEVPSPELEATLLNADIAGKWEQMLKAPDYWYDNRASRKNPRAPDFKFNSKNVDAALWIDSKDTPDAAIAWLTSFERPTLTDDELRTATKEQQWVHWAYNRKAYFDNRNKKLNPRAPDFTHKDLKDDKGLRVVSLWLDRPAAPPVQRPAQARAGSGPTNAYKARQQQLQQQAQTANTTNTLDLSSASIEEKWDAVRDHPNAWFDNRTGKRNPKAPDFKLKDRNVDVALWLSSTNTPEWAKEQFGVASA